MNVKFLAACAAAWLVLPLAASAASDSATVGLAKAGGDLLTPEDYIEYASINDVNIHELYFSAILYEGTESCLMCHQETAESMLGMGHFRWQGKVENIVGQKGQDVGKNQLLNNFCIAVPTNEPRCTQCHTGYGYADKNYNFNDPANIDCLVCHDQSGTYAKAPKTAGLPEPGRYAHLEHAGRRVPAGVYVVRVTHDGDVVVDSVAADDIVRPNPGSTVPPCWLNAGAAVAGSSGAADPSRSVVARN